MPIVQDVFFSGIRNWSLNFCFTAFITLFLISIVFTIRLIIPSEIAYLGVPKKYYEEYRLTYEKTIKEKEKVDNLLKASYISELETALSNNELVFRKKSSFYYNALMYALLSVIPYLICLGFHISKKEDVVQKVQTVSPEINSKLHKTDTMSENNNKSSDNSTLSSTATTTTTRLPGVDNSQVISSSPDLIKENSQHPTIKKK